MVTQDALTDPFHLLLEIESRGIESSPQLARQEEASGYWSGIGFILDHVKYVTPLKEVAEVLTMKDADKNVSNANKNLSDGTKASPNATKTILGPTKIPGAKPWVKGIANIRGTLLPIMDLNGYLGNKISYSNQKQRILVINHQGIYSGIIVDEVLGLQHFQQSERLEGSLNLEDSIKPYVVGGFHRANETWGIFSLFALAEHPDFLQVAL